MSEQPLSEDELASALLDGEATAPRPVEPTVAARVDELRRAADAIGQPVVVDDASREQAIAAALQMFDDLPASAATEPLSTRRARLTPTLAAVAAAVLVLVGVVAVLRHDGSTPAETASGAEALAASGAATAPTTMAAFGGSGGTLAPQRSATNDASSQGGATPAAAVAPAPSARDLGNLSDVGALRAAIGPEAFTTKAAQVESTPTACEAEARTGSATDLGTLTVDVTLHWKGQPARALVFVDAASASHIVIVADPSCVVLDRIV
jgi:hypothetical protein